MLTNLQGFEYYKGGVFELKSTKRSATPPVTTPHSKMIDHFDWRTRHGANDPSSPYYDALIVDLRKAGTRDSDLLERLRALPPEMRPPLFALVPHLETIELAGVECVPAPPPSERLAHRILAMSAGRATDLSASGHSSVASSPKGLRILLAEDDAVNREVGLAILEVLGYRAEIARNGQEALDLLESEHFPLVVTDWVMPEMDGVEFCRAVRSRKYAGYVYIILLTARESKADVLQGLDAGADDYLVKPIDFDELAMRLKTGERIFKLEQ